MQKHILSKSTFIKGMQCEKALYLSKHHRELKDPINPSLEAIFVQGNQVGELAQQLFPGGIDCTPESYFDFQKAVIRTKEEIEKGTKVIYEAAFQFNGVLAALDILVHDEDEWKAYEVKSSTSVSNTYKLDAAIQYYTITSSGIPLVDISIVHINNQYVKNGKLSINDLFTIASVKQDVETLQLNINDDIERLKKVLLENEIPEKEIGPHCSSPYACDFAGHCWKDIPNYSVFNIARLKSNKKFDLYQKGFLKLNDIPANYPLNEKQWQQVHAEVRDETYIDTKRIQSFVNQLTYPLYFLDFETFATAVPVLNNSKPYQQLVFQYSLHIEQKDSQLIHKEFLAETDGSDPRKSFVEQLIKDCDTEGDIIVYNIGFERGKVEGLIRLFPEYKEELESIIERLVDLMVPFQKKWYYTPSMKGSYSIKKVLPALVPKLSYKDLIIQEGGTASNTYAAMFLGTFKGDIQQTRTDLLEYCKLDTLAMVEILNKLKEV